MTLSRRRFLVISAAAASGLGSPARAQAQWSGRALGAAATMRLEGLNDAEAAPVFAAVAAEIARLEQIFSLYLPGSDLVRLNSTGRLPSPPPDMLRVLSLADTVHAASGGAFDPTVQPLWRAHAKALTAEDGRRPLSDHAPFGWSNVRFDTRAVVLAKPGMALTLNGIAQGYITDRVNALLADHGLTDILIDVGEVRARGTGPDQRPWTAGVRDLDGQIVQRVQLHDRALATSAAYGLMLNHGLGIGHILHPTMRPAHSLVAISAPNAALADALSTAGILLPPARLRAAVRRFPDTDIIHANQKGTF